MKIRKPIQCVLLALFACSSHTIAHAQSGGMEADAPLQGADETMPENATFYGHNGLTLNGAVGNPLNPIAEIPTQGSYRVQADYFDLGDLKVENNFSDGSGIPGTFGENFGEAKFYGVHIVGRPFNAPIEVSGGIERLRARGNTLQGPVAANKIEFDGLDTTSFSVGAKWQFYRSAEGTTMAAVGAGYSRALFNNYNAYIVGTKVLGVSNRIVLVHAGARYDRFEIDGENRVVGLPDSRFGDTSTKFSLFAGAEIPIDKRGRFSLVGEIGTKNAQNFNLGDFGFAGAGEGVLHPKFPYSLSLRYAANGLAASLGMMRQGVANDTGVFGQVGKTF